MIRAYVQEECEIAEFETANQEYVGRSLRLVRLMGMLWPHWKSCLASPSCWFSGSGDAKWFTDDNGRRLRGIQYLHGATNLAIIALGWVINIFQRGTASMGTHQPTIELKGRRSTIATRRRPIPSTAQIEGDIEFRDLNFCYNGTQYCTTSICIFQRAAVSPLSAQPARGRQRW